MRFTFRADIQKLITFCILAVLLGLGGVRVQAQEGQAGNGMTAQANPNIVREVRHQLAMLPYYTVFDWLQAQVNGNDVTLTGVVVNPINKNDAEANMKKIEGVGRVINNIKILPPSPMDEQIRRAEYRAIFGFSDLGRYAFMNIPSIHIVVEGGHVTLYGIVNSEADKNMVNIRARGVPNVFSVVNNLQVVKG